MPRLKDIRAEEAYAARTEVPSFCGTVPIDVDRLIDTGLAIEANSGAGKSWALRRLCEQTHGRCQQLVLDPEGEYHTLRERFDYVLAGKGGECPAEVESAGLLARRLLELNVSAVIDFSHLGVRRPAFVKHFIDGLMDAPRELWHVLMVVIDEAGKFCPETDNISTASIINLMTTGRKRGYGRILATQRISTINKSALAECNNVMIGRTALDIDIARAMAILGMRGQDAKDQIKNLEDGQFFGYGPALSGREVKKFTVGAVVTTHPRPGQRALPPAPPTANIRALLGQLANIPAEAATEARSVDDLRAKVRELEAAVVRARKEPLSHLTDKDRKDLGAKIEAQAAKNDAREREHETLKKEVALLRKDVLENIKLRDRAYGERDEWRGKFMGLVAQTAHVQSELQDIVSSIDKPLVIAKKDAAKKPTSLMDAVNEARGKIKEAGIVVDAKAWQAGKAELSKLERAILIALAQHPSGLTKHKALLHAMYRRSGNTDQAFAKMSALGWVVADGPYAPLVITSDGLAALGEFDPLPTGDALRKHVLAGRQLSDLEKRLLTAICDAFPAEITKADALVAANYKRSGNTDQGFAHLLAIGYVHNPSRQNLVAAAELFG